MLRKLITPPIFEDDELTHTVSQLWTVVMVMTFMSALYVAVWVITVPELTFRIIFALPLFPLFAWLFHLLKRGQVKLAANILVIGCWIILMTATAFSGGVLAPGYSGLLITVLVAGIFISREAALRIASLSVISGAVLIYLERRGMLPPASQFTDSTSMWIAQAVYFFIGASLLRMATIRISNAFERAKHEIEERKKAETALRNAELLYRTMVEQTSVVIYRDAAVEGGPSMYISPQIKDMIGYTSEEFSSRPEFWQSLLHPEDREMVFGVIERIIETGENITCEYRMKARNGNWVWVRDEAGLIRGADGNPLYVQGVYVDITAQKLMESQRESLIAELEAKNAELERFTYTVSHDLKSPLITMGGFLGFLEKDALNGDLERLRFDIQRISEANQKMEALLNDLLELSRIGRLINEPETTAFSDIVFDALSRVKKQLDENRVQINVGSDLPMVRGDRLRLVEVVQNLVENAAKFAQLQPEPRIEIGSIFEEGHHIFFVRDNGVGIDPKHHDKVFELFTKLDPNMNGTGVGLAIVRRIIEVHGGRIWIESEPGRGATFWFTLAGN